MSKDDQIDVIHQKINACTVCKDLTPGFRKPPPLYRGVCGRILIVGEGPGSSEVERKVAFAGQAGRRLDEWLILCGANPSNPRENLYFTSVVKCISNSKSSLPKMAQRCMHFLHDQVLIIRPELLITLGRIAYDNLRFSQEDYSTALCKPQHSEQLLLVPTLNYHFLLLPWPHPSGLNRWHNEVGNKKRLADSFEFVRTILRKEGK